MATGGVVPEEEVEEFLDHHPAPAAMVLRVPVAAVAARMGLEEVRAPPVAEHKILFGLKLQAVRSPDRAVEEEVVELEDPEFQDRMALRVVVTVVAPEGQDSTTRHLAVPAPPASSSSCMAPDVGKMFQITQRSFASYLTTVEDLLR